MLQDMRIGGRTSHTSREVLTAQARRLPPHRFADTPESVQPQP